MAFARLCGVVQKLIQLAAAGWGSVDVRPSFMCLTLVSCCNEIVFLWEDWFHPSSSRLHICFCSAHEEVRLARCRDCLGMRREEAGGCVVDFHSSAFLDASSSGVQHSLTSDVKGWSWPRRASWTLWLCCGRKPVQDSEIPSV